jgi:hypothetical protein
VVEVVKGTLVVEGFLVTLEMVWIAPWISKITIFPS